VVAGDAADAGGVHDVLGSRLGTHGSDGGDGRTHELNASVKTSLGEVSVLGEETVTGVDGLGTDLLGELDDVVTTEVRLCGSGRTNVVSLISHLDEHRVSIRVREDSNSLNTKLLTGTNHTACNLTTVSNENLIEGLRKAIIDPKAAIRLTDIGFPSNLITL
jgi:hypothetical protein